jgi:hypothetical protein
MSSVWLVLRVNMLGARGRYVWETWTQDDIQRQLRSAQEGLNTFRSQDNGHRPGKL